MSEDIEAFRKRLEALQAKKAAAAPKPEPVPEPQEDEQEGDDGAEKTEGDENAKKEADDKSVWIGGVDYSAKKETLDSFFSACGTIVRSTIPMDPRTKRTKGYAYIEFATKEGMKNALLLNDHLFAGKCIKVLPKRENKPGLGLRRRRMRRFPR